MTKKRKPFNWRILTTFSALELFSMPLIFILLGMSRLIILTLPARYYYHFLGVNKRTLCFTPLLNRRQTQQAYRIGLVVRAVANRTPWESKCLVQAIVARLALGCMKIPYGLFFGVANNVNEQGVKELKAHAWLCSGAVYVTGGFSWHQFTVVASYYNRT